MPWNIPKVLLPLLSEQMAYICTTITLRNMQKEICNMFPCAQLLHHDTMICDHPMITINRSAWCTSTVSLYHTSLVSTYKYYIVNVCVNFKKYIYKWTVSFIWVFFYTERSYISYIWWTRYKLRVKLKKK